MNKEMIKEEIKKNGNTNLIADSGLSSQIFALGDSHTIFFYNSLLIKEHWAGKIPLTIYTLINSPPNIYEIGNLLGNGHEKYNIKENDFVLFFYGFNDIQKNIYLYAKDRWKDEILNLFTNYVLLLKYYENHYKIVPIITCIYPNPRPEAQGQNPKGSLEERRLYTLEANNVLKKLALEYNLLYYDVYDFITDKEGFIKKEYTRDNIHLDYDNDFLREYIDNIILDMCKFKLSFPAMAKNDVTNIFCACAENRA